MINIDGLDSDRRKWPPLAKAYLRFAESRAPRWADLAITDSHQVADIYEQRYGTRIGVVPYGVEDPGYDGTETLERLGLEPREYVLFVGRLEPENNPHESGVDDLARQLGRLLDDPELVASYRSRALRRAREYSWEAITDEYERLLTQVCDASRHGPLPSSMLDLELADDQPPEPVSVAQKAAGLL